MKLQTYSMIVGIIFLLVAILHLVRAIYSWQLLVNNSFSLPVWISWVGFVVASVLSYFGFKFSKN